MGWVFVNVSDELEICVCPTVVGVSQVVRLARIWSRVRNVTSR